MKIQALGGCCKRSQLNYDNAVKAAEVSGTGVIVEHVTDPVAIAALGVLATPGIVIDGKVMSHGRVASVADVLIMIEKQKPVEAPKTSCCEGACACEDGKCECEDGNCECEGGNCECEDGNCECRSADERCPDGTN